MFLWRNKKNISTFLMKKKCLIWSYEEHNFAVGSCGYILMNSYRLTIADIKSFQTTAIYSS